MAKCKHKMGLLSLRTCGQEATTRCQKCNIAICYEHAVQTDTGPLCFECAADTGQDAEETNDGMRRVHRRRSYYRSSGYDPYWHHHHYDSFDRNSQGDASGESDSDGVIDADDFQDS